MRCAKSVAPTFGVIALCLWAGPAPAAFISGTGDPSAAIPGGAVVNFDSGPTGRFNTPATVTLNGVTFGGVGGFYDIDSDFIGSFNTRGVNSLSNDFPPGGTQTFTFDFAGPVGAFAFLFGASDFTWRLTAFNSGGGVVEAYDIAAVFGSNAGDYFGISASGMTRATLQNLGGEADYVFIDNFTFARESVSAVPVPPSLALLASGAVGLLGVARRRGVRARVA